MKVSLNVGAVSHRGLVREENQDRISRSHTPFGELFLVADGMGGHDDGGRAAAMTIEHLESHLRHTPPETPTSQALQAAADAANETVYHAATADGDGHLMGATLVLALLRGRRLRVAHAGDSRAYLFRGGSLTRLTRDHSHVQRMIDHQVLTEEEARHHPDASVVTRAFGQEPELEIEIAEPLELSDGDRVLLCSDGLCGYVDDATLEGALPALADVQDSTRRLIELALAAGGEDNVSVQLIEIRDAARAAETATRKPVTASFADRLRNWIAAPFGAAERRPGRSSAKASVVGEAS